MTRILLVVSVFLTAVGCGGEDTKPPTPTPAQTPDPSKAPKPPKGEKLALPQ